MRDGGIVDQNVNASLFIHDPAYERCIRFVIGNIQPADERLASSLANPGACGFDMRTSVGALRTTVPSPANSLAIAAPIPCAAPVTNAIFPASLILPLQRALSEKRATGSGSRRSESKSLTVTGHIWLDAVL